MFRIIYIQYMIMCSRRFCLRITRVLLNIYLKGERKLFDKASFFLQEGEKAGIIGINGTGKSTLLKIIAGIEKPDSGNVILANHLAFIPEE